MSDDQKEYVEHAAIQAICTKLREIDPEVSVVEVWLASGDTRIDIKLDARTTMSLDVTMTYEDNEHPVHQVHQVLLNSDIVQQTKEVIDEYISLAEESDALEFLYTHVHEELEAASTINLDYEPLEHHVDERVMAYIQEATAS